MSETVLIVEDEALIAAHIQNVLAGAGYTVLPPASRGEEALVTAVGRHPDLVLMDIQLGGTMNGIEAAALIRSECDVPIIYLTAYADDARLEQAQLTEPYGYLVKPVESRELLATMKMALYKHGLDEKLRESEGRYRAVVTQASEGIILFDSRTRRVIDVNPAFKKLFGYTDEEIGSLTMYDIIESPGDGVDRYCEQIVREQQCSLGEQRFRCRDHRALSVEVSAGIIQYRGRDAIICVVAHDVTERRRAEDALREANRQLNLLGSITRHDILNKVTVALGYIGVMRRMSTDPALEAYITKLESATKTIRSQIEFTKVYQDLGIHDPQWQELGRILIRLQAPEPIALNADVKGFEVFADPMLERVFFNLLDNSIRHGQHVTEITVSSVHRDEELIIAWEDNGTGIATDEKEQIFERSFGKNTGLGLFLAREILSLTGVGIRETGTPGEGARFEMAVPDGAWRCTSAQVHDVQ